MFQMRSMSLALEPSSNGPCTLTAGQALPAESGTKDRCGTETNISDLSDTVQVLTHSLEEAVCISRD